MIFRIIIEEFGRREGGLLVHDHTKMLRGLCCVLRDDALRFSNFQHYEDCDYSHLLVAAGLIEINLISQKLLVLYSALAE
jgi:hypothetical protein